MVTKTLTIMEDAYELLVQNKKEGESFSDVIRRIAKTEELASFAGMISEEQGEEILRERKKDWR